jgi:hypothetical protein
MCPPHPSTTTACILRLLMRNTAGPDLSNAYFTLMPLSLSVPLLLVACRSPPITGAKTTQMLSSPQPQHRAAKTPHPPRQSQPPQLRARPSTTSPNFDFDPKQWMNDPVFLADKVGHSMSHTLNSLTAMASRERPFFYELLWCV